MMGLWACSSLVCISENQSFLSDRCLFTEINLFPSPICHFCEEMGLCQSSFLKHGAREAKGRPVISVVPHSIANEKINGLMYIVAETAAQCSNRTLPIHNVAASIWVLIGSTGETRAVSVVHVFVTIAVDVVQSKSIGQ